MVYIAKKSNKSYDNNGIEWAICMITSNRNYISLEMRVSFEYILIAISLCPLYTPNASLWFFSNKSISVPDSDDSARNMHIAFEHTLKMSHSTIVSILINQFFCCSFHTIVFRLFEHMNITNTRITEIALRHF